MLRRTAMGACAMLLAAAGLVAFAAPAQAATTTLTYTVSPSDPVASRIGGSAEPCTLPAVGVDVHYAMAVVTVDVSGGYLGSDLYLTGGDGLIAFYAAPFDPADPTAGCVGSIDDASFGTAVQLEAGATYYLFQSTYYTGSTGVFGFEIEGPGTLSVVSSVAPTTTAVTSDAATVTQPATSLLTATVSGASPTGTVEFRDGSTSLGFAPVVAGVATLSVALPPGMRSITAVYAGDAANAPSISPPYLQTVVPAVAPTATTTTVASDANPVAAGGSVRLTASVIGAGGAPTGSVELFDGTVSLGTAPLVDRVAEVTVTPPVGSHAITAVYSGDATNLASTSAVLTQVVTGPAVDPTTTPRPAPGTPAPGTPAPGGPAVTAPGASAPRAPAPAPSAVAASSTHRLPQTGADAAVPATLAAVLLTAGTAMLLTTRRRAQP